MPVQNNQNQAHGGDNLRQNIANAIRPDPKQQLGDKAQLKADHAREGVSDAVRPGQPGVGEKMARGARDSAQGVKDAVNKGLNAAADAIQPGKKQL